MLPEGVALTESIEKCGKPGLNTQSLKKSVRLTTGGGGGYLDHTLLGASEDSIILLYRKNSSENWREYEHYTQNLLGGSTPKYGYMTIDTLILGEYTFGYGDKTPLSNKETTHSENNILIYPNPASCNVTIQFKNLNNDSYYLNVFDVAGKQVYNTYTSSDRIILDTGKWKNGFYFLSITGNVHPEIFKKLVIVK